MMLRVRGAEFSAGALLNTLLFGEVGFGDSYMNGGITIDGDLSKWIEKNKNGTGYRVLPYFPRTSRRVADHYNIPKEFYRLLLGQSMAYTCGNYDGNANLSLDDSQERKYKFHADWLNIKPEQQLKVLDCGCGWGGFSHYLSEVYPDSRVYGISVAQEQLNYANQNPSENCPTYLNIDWRAWEHHLVSFKKFDRFTAIGMLEHVGQRNLPRFFDWISRTLTDQGSGTLQFISRQKPMSKWFDKHIFPTAYTPWMNEVRMLMADSGLMIQEKVERGQDYALTLEAWLKNFEANLSEIRHMGFDQKFIRMFRLYLNGGIASFRSGESQLYQIKFQKVSV